MMELLDDVQCFCVTSTDPDWRLICLLVLVRLNSRHHFEDFHCV